ncbi:MAG: epoxyqueuosine reductase, partial [Mogibacterium sp.]|nr:epoxyqueuosine reductase [Mogibacterium sp.]
MFTGCSYPVGVAVAASVPAHVAAHVAADLKTAPTKEYYELYDILNDRLNQIIKAGESFLKECGFDALARTTDIVKVDEDFNSGLPHKTVATRAGLGWIGKNNLLVTPEYGSAIRISSLLTDAPLET